MVPTTPSASPQRRLFQASTVLGLVFALVLCLLGGACQQQGLGTYLPKEGDILFQSLEHNPLIDAIEGSTGSPYSHCGIVHRSGPGWVVIEAIGPVKETDLAAWIRQGRGGRFAAYRLQERHQASIPAFIEAAQSYEGLPYDIHYDLDDDAIYCSELIFKAFRRATGEELGKIQTLGELKWQPYVEVIEHIEGGKVPLERKMITPRSLSEAGQLMVVHPW